MGYHESITVRRTYVEGFNEPRGTLVPGVHYYRPALPSILDIVRLTDEMLIPAYACNLGGGSPQFSNTPCRDECPNLAHPCSSTPPTKLFGGYRMLQALFMNEVSNLLPGFCAPSGRWCLSSASFSTALTKSPVRKDSSVCLCVSSPRGHFRSTSSRKIFPLLVPRTII